MATSGTWGFTLDNTEIIEKAYILAGGEARSGYDYRLARISLDLLLLDWQNRGLNLWTVKAATQSLTAGTATYTLAAERIDIIEGLLRTDAGDATAQNDLHMRRMSVSTYAQQSNKLRTGKPTQYWVDRQPAAIEVTLWPVPDSSSYQFVYYYLERIEDAGDGAKNVDVPARFLPALIYGLAVEIAMQIPEGAAKVDALNTRYERFYMDATDAHREKANLRLVPKIYS